MKYFKRFLLSAVITGLIVSCNDKDNPPVRDSFDTKIKANSDLSILAAAIEKAKLTTFTTGPGPFTLYAPNNAAFNAMGINSAADLNLLDSNLLTTIMTYHIQTGARTSYEIPVGPNGTIATISGYNLYASKTATGDAYINGAKLVQKDIFTSNGIMHIINKVLLPPLNTTLINLGLNPNTKLFLQAINKAAVTSSFTGNPITVFAPTNAAMTAAGYDSVSIANASAATITTLANIIKYHVVGSRIFTNDLKDGNLKTLQGTNVVISAGGTKIKGTTNPAAFNFTITNIVSSNGVLHVIDGVLIP